MLRRTATTRLAAALIAVPLALSAGCSGAEDGQGDDISTNQTDTEDGDDEGDSED